MKHGRHSTPINILGSSSSIPAVAFNTEQAQLAEDIIEKKFDCFSEQDEKVKDEVLMLKKDNFKKKARNLQMNLDSRFDLSRINTMVDLNALARIDSAEREELSSPVSRSVEYFDARSSLPGTPSSASSTTPSESIGSPSNHNSDYFSRPFRNVESKTTLSSIPSSPLPVPSSSSPYSTLMVPLVSSPVISQSSSLESNFFMESTASENLSPSRIYSNDAIDLSGRDTAVELANLSNSANSDLPERRYHALTELIETETSYLGILKLLVEVYFQALPALSTLSNADVELIYRNSRDLLELHERLVTRLNDVEAELIWMRSKGSNKEHDLVVEQKEMETICKMVANIYLEEIPSFQLYNDFCARHLEASQLMISLESTPQWEIYTQLCSESIASPTLPRHSSSSAPTTPTVPTFQQPTSKSFPTTNNRLTSSHTTPSTSRLHSKLRVQDYLIQPVQRICRMPLLFGSILKHLDDCPEKKVVQNAYNAMCEIARNADEAKTKREVEVRTKIVSLRMEFVSTVHSAFRDVLGPVLLIHAMNVLHRQLAEPTKIKYYGIFLYQTHIVFVKVKKREVYEPREWLPLRLFELSDIENGEGIMPYSLRLSYRDHHFELGASCQVEKEIWKRRISAAKTQATQVWESQRRMDRHGRPTLFDETVVSSVSPIPSSNIPPVIKTHIRSKSAGSIVAVTLVKTVRDEVSPSELSPVLGSLSLSSRNRFSTTASSLLGKTPESARSAIDIRLADVASPECVTARAQAIREESSRYASSRPNSSKGRSKSVLRRLSLADGNKVLETFNASELGLMLDIGTNGEDWNSTLKRSSASRRQSLEIDTNVSLLNHTIGRSRSASWRTRTLSLKAHSRDGSTSSKISTNLVDVERNNSTSSQSTTSSGTGHSSIITTATSFDSPYSSIPSSPTFSPDDLQKIDSNIIKPSRQYSHSSSIHSSTTGASDENSSSSNKLSRRSSFVGNFFSKRVQSSPSLSNVFNPSPPASPNLSTSFSDLSSSLYPDLPSPSPMNASSRSLVLEPTTPSSSIRPKLGTSGVKPTRSKSIRFFFSANKFTTIN